MMPPMANLRALLVSYSFPPVGGAGVQRVLKLAKYLPAHGVTPTVLTVSNPSVPVVDASLEKDFPPGMRVIRVPTFEPGYGLKKAAWKVEKQEGPSERKEASPLERAKNEIKQAAIRKLSSVAKEMLVPDPQVLWQPSAQIALLRELVAKEKPDVVFISGPPFSQFLLTPLVRIARSSALVLDYRDEWSTYRTTYEMMGSSIGKKVGDALEERLFHLAHRVTAATDEFRDNLLSMFGGASDRVRAIPNGYDVEDVPETLDAQPVDKLTLVYAGTLFKLTSIRGLVGGMRRLRERRPDLADKLRLKIFGRIVDTEEDMFHDAEALGIERLGYVPHAEVFRALSKAHKVLCTLDEVPGVERIYPAKIFEIMALGRPALILSPPGTLTRLVDKHRLGDLLPPRDEVAIASYLEREVLAFMGGTLALRSSAVGIERYSRKALAGEFAEVMREAVSVARR